MSDSIDLAKLIQKWVKIHLLVCPGLQVIRCSEKF